MDKVIKNDGKSLVDLLGLDDGTLEEQEDYCFMASKNDDRVDIWAEPTDETGDEIRIYEVDVNDEQVEFCTNCGELMPLVDLKEEKDLGLLCDRCLGGYQSRGEKLTIVG